MCRGLPLLLSLSYAYSPIHRLILQLLEPYLTHSAQKPKVRSEIQKLTRTFPGGGANRLHHITVLE